MVLLSSTTGVTKKQLRKDYFEQAKECFDKKYYFASIILAAATLEMAFKHVLEKAHEENAGDLEFKAVIDKVKPYLPSGGKIADDAIEGATRVRLVRNFFVHPSGNLLSPLKKYPDIYKLAERIMPLINPQRASHYATFMICQKGLSKHVIDDCEKIFSIGGVYS